MKDPVQSWGLRFAGETYRKKRDEDYTHLKFIRHFAPETSKTIRLPFVGGACNFSRGKLLMNYRGWLFKQAVTLKNPDFVGGNN